MLEHSVYEATVNQSWYKNIRVYFCVKIARRPRALTRSSFREVRGVNRRWSEFESFILWTGTFKLIEVVLLNSISSLSRFVSLKLKHWIDSVTLMLGKSKHIWKRKHVRKQVCVTTTKSQPIEWMMSFHVAILFYPIETHKEVSVRIEFKVSIGMSPTSFPIASAAKDGRQ